MARAGKKDIESAEAIGANANAATHSHLERHTRVQAALGRRAVSKIKTIGKTKRTATATA